MKKLILLLILIAGTLVVSGQKIADLTRATTTVATELLIIDQTATTSGISITNFFKAVPVAVTITGTTTTTDAIITNMATANTTVATYTSTGQLDSLETKLLPDLTLASISVDSVGVNAYLIVDRVFNYAADAQGDDDYEVAIPGITALIAGLQVTFIANTANTDGATLEITSVGDLDAILKQHDTVLTSNDIEAGSVVVCVWDGSNWQMVSPAAN